MAACQCPFKKYNQQLMMAILWDRMDYLGKVMNVEGIPLKKGSRGVPAVRRWLLPKSGEGTR